MHTRYVRRNPGSWGAWTGVAPCRSDRRRSGRPVAAEVVDDELLRVRTRWLRGPPVVGELVDAEHELHGIAGGLLDRLDQPVVDEERDVLRCPFGRVDVELPGVDGDDLDGELVDDGRIGQGMQSHADAGAAGRHVAF